ncbi:MAG: isoprenylcysteine carboxylmethyltransferase family protein [Theionarchaea archaeon]|nr:isoprenylcysteine carboxylmethyltransferase family protein [Theionarchaea archaeon]
MEEITQPEKKIGRKAILGFVVYTLGVPLLLFIAAGTFDWMMAWVYVILLIGFMVVSRIMVIRRNPELARERARFIKAENACGLDRIIVFVSVIMGPFLIFIVAGIDRRFSWSPQIPFIVQLLALVILLAGFLITTWAMTANPFFSAVVRIQKERAHTVIKEGPYRFIRHPGYAASLMTVGVTPLILGSLWVFIPVIFMTILGVIRTSLEDKTLREELEGYEDYVREVPYRLIPGVW